jgi:hypothetical protein
MGPVQVLTLGEIHVQLESLKKLLQNLPATVPDTKQHYFFDTFTPDPESVDDRGTEGAVNHALEVAFSPTMGRAEPIVFKERGLGLVSVVETLRTYLKQFPESVVLQKWVSDLTDAAKRMGAIVTVSVCRLLYVIGLTFDELGQ